MNLVLLYAVGFIVYGAAVDIWAKLQLTFSYYGSQWGPWNITSILPNIFLSV